MHVQTTGHNQVGLGAAAPRLGPRLRIRWCPSDGRKPMVMVSLSSEIHVQSTQSGSSCFGARPHSVLDPGTYLIYWSFPYSCTMCRSPAHRVTRVLLSVLVGSSVKLFQHQSSTTSVLTPGEAIDFILNSFHVYFDRVHASSNISCRNPCRLDNQSRRIRRRFAVNPT